MAYETALWQGHAQVASYRGSAGTGSADAVTSAPFSAAAVMISNRAATTNVLYVNFAGGVAENVNTDRLEVPPATTVTLPIKVAFGSKITIAASVASTAWNMSLFGGE